MISRVRAGPPLSQIAGFEFPIRRTALRDTRVVAISGPRQSGKTTLARRFAKQGREFVTLDNQSTLAAAKSDPAAFIRDLDRAVID
jgi:hypothetical protein